MNEIFERISVRDYQQKPVEQEKIQKLLAAAMSAPTAGNQREWEFIVVDDRSLLERLSIVSPYAGCAAKAPLAIVILANVKGVRYADYWQQDCGASAQNILLEAVSLGLGGVWMGIAPLENRMKAVSDMFDLPEYVKPFAIIGLGYPSHEGKQHDRFDADRVHTNGYRIRIGE